MKADEYEIKYILEATTKINGWAGLKTNYK
jgi:hypothetical protein